jgi:hypothetical protein
MQSKEFLTRFADAFKCLETVGLSRRRLQATAHEYEVWYSSRRYAVRLTLERQWSYEYLFVELFQRSETGEAFLRGVADITCTCVRQVVGL